MNEIITAVGARRNFLQLLTMAPAFVLAPPALRAQPREAGEPTTPATLPAGPATFEDVWRTVRDRFYDPHLRGLDWSAIREHYVQDAAHAASEEELATVINRMLSELHASHTRYYTLGEPEYYQLADIFAGALRRQGLQRAFPGGNISYPGIGVLSRIDAKGSSIVTGVIDGTPAQQAGLMVGDELIAADDVPFQPVRSFQGRVGSQVKLEVHRSGSNLQALVAPIDIEPNKMFLDGMKASARILLANGRRIGYAHVWCYAGYAYQRTLEGLLSQGALKDADALIWDDGNH